MSRATSYTLNDRMELAGPPEDKQITEAKRWLRRIKVREQKGARMARHGVKVERLPQTEDPTIKRDLIVPNL